MSNRRPDSLHFSLNWQQQLSECITTIEDLCDYLGLSPQQLPAPTEAEKKFPLRVPVNFAASMEKGNPNDPLLRQVLPINDELIDYPGYGNDPVGDINAAVLPGILHKYHGRVLLINTGSCAINCRYCFRRNFPYNELQIGKRQEHQVVEYIQSDHSIVEVILSGGDPLVLNDSRLNQLLSRLKPVKHVKRIRIHSRLPIVLPARITDEFVETLVNCGKRVVLVVHCNHANEINDRVIAAFIKLTNKGITLLNQSVLLKGINDNATALCELSERLFDIGVLPYYLHTLDKASGTGHFEVSEAKALALIKEIQNRMPGYLVPKLVKEIAGAEAKQPVIA